MTNYSIIVPCYKSLDKVYQLVQSLIFSCDLRTTEIILSDDACPEYNLTELPFPPGITVRRNAENLGFAGNVNAAVLASHNPYICILNQDIRTMPFNTDAPELVPLMKPGWLDQMQRVFEEHENAGIVGPRLVFPDGKIQSVGGWFGGDKGPFHRFLGWGDPTFRLYAETEKVSWITGAAIMLRRDDWDSLGGLRGDLYPGGYFEDVDLCMRLIHDLGKEVWYCADATLIHFVGSTGGNPNFRVNSKTFHRLWDDKITIDEPHVYVGY